MLFLFFHFIKIYTTENINTNVFWIMKHNIRENYQKMKNLQKLETRLIRQITNDMISPLLKFYSPEQIQCHQRFQPSLSYDLLIKNIYLVNQIVYNQIIHNCNSTLVGGFHLKKIAWITDSTCYIEPDFAKQHNIFVLPMQISFDNETYRDGIDITEAEFYQMKFA